MYRFLISILQRCCKGHPNEKDNTAEVPLKGQHLMWIPLKHNQGYLFFSSRKSELFPSAKHHLPNPSPTSKLQLPPNQGHRSIFCCCCLLLFVCVWFGGGVSQSVKCSLGCTMGCLKGGVTPSEAGKFCIYETGIMQFGEYSGADLEQAMSKEKKQFCGPDWPKFCILGKMVVKILLESLVIFLSFFKTHVRTFSPV